MCSLCRAQLAISRVWLWPPYQRFGSAQPGEKPSKKEEKRTPGADRQDLHTLLLESFHFVPFVYRVCCPVPVFSREFVFSIYSQSVDGRQCVNILLCVSGVRVCRFLVKKSPKNQSAPQNIYWVFLAQQQICRRTFARGRVKNSVSLLSTMHFGGCVSVCASECVCVYICKWLDVESLHHHHLHKHLAKNRRKTQAAEQKREPLKTTAAAKSERATNAAKQARQLFINLKR